MRDALDDLRNLRQSTNEDESAYASRINKAAYRCGNDHHKDHKMTFFINGVQPSIRTIVSRFRENEQYYSLSFEKLIQFAKDEGDSHRARMSAFNPSSSAVSNPRLAGAEIKSLRSTRSSPPPRMVTFIEPTGLSGGTVVSAQDEQEELNAWNKGTPEDSIPTFELPSTVLSVATLEESREVNQEELILAFLESHKQQRTQQVALPPLAYGGGSNRGRVRWIDQPRPPIIYRGCYRNDDHILPQCNVSIFRFNEIVKNYKSLSADDKARVPDKCYELALTIVKGTPESKLATAVAQAQSKN